MCECNNVTPLYYVVIINYLSNTIATLILQTCAAHFLLSLTSSRSAALLLL